MNLVRFQHPAYRNNLDQLFSHLLNNNSEKVQSSVKCFRPAVNIAESDKDYQLEFSVPGYKKEHFSIKSHEGQLSVKANPESTEEALNYNRREFSVDPFERSFILPDSVNDEDISASYSNGILRIVIPKVEEENKTHDRQIAIN